MGRTYTVKHPWIDGVTFTWRCTVRGREDEYKGIVLQRRENVTIEGTKVAERLLLKFSEENPKAKHEEEARRCSGDVFAI